MFIKSLNSKQNLFAAPELHESVLPNLKFFSSLLKMTQKLFLAENSNINIFHITQYFWLKNYKCNQ